VTGSVARVHLRQLIHLALMLRCQCPSVCPSVCDGSPLWPRCMPGRKEGSSRAMLATARPSCNFYSVRYSYCTRVGIESRFIDQTVSGRDSCAGLTLMNVFFRAFEYFILTTIFANCVALAINTPYPNNDSDEVNDVLVRISQRDSSAGQYPVARSPSRS